jgi:tRNA threonylcarbamoyladenosine biosynthesis protein TsaB
VNVLAIDGALGGFSTAVATDGALVAVRSLDANVALESGLATIGEALTAASVGTDRLDRIAVGVGPGGFTGLRIAIAYAKSLALAWQKPLVAVSSFDLLEQGRTLDRIMTVVVGRPGVISVRYRDAGGVRRGSGRILEVLDAIAPATTALLPVIGAPKDALAALAERGIVVQSLDPLVTPAAAAAALAAASLRPARSLHEVRADYGELPAAKVPKLK